MYTIYGLIDPRTYAIRYVGMTMNHPEVRLQQHLKEFDGERGRWLEELKRIGSKPSIVILDFAPDFEEAGKKERWWITQGVVTGWSLTNDSHTSNGRRRREARMHRQPTPKITPELTDIQRRVAEYLQANPDASVRPMARDLGIGKSYAGELREEYLRRPPVIDNLAQEKGGNE